MSDVDIVDRVVVVFLSAQTVRYNIKDGNN